MLLIHLITTTVEEIHNGVVAMGKTLLSCCLCCEIMARWHGPALAMMYCTSFTRSYQTFPKIATSYTIDMQTQIYGQQADTKPNISPHCYITSMAREGPRVILM
jgi:hypothetical protein